MMDTKRLLNTKEVAEWLGISVRTVCLWAECDELPAIRIGKQWRFRHEQITAWLTIRENHEKVFILSGQCTTK